ncbi:galactose-3-O-sulfotransferase 2-like isoform X2 [Babylonia areolata]
MIQKKIFTVTIIFGIAMFLAIFPVLQLDIRHYLVDSSSMVDPDDRPVPTNHPRHGQIYRKTGKQVVHGRSHGPGNPSWKSDGKTPPRRNTTSALDKPRAKRPPKQGKEKEYAWNANRTPGEVQHIIFVKVHKAGSTTLFNVFLRFSVSRQLNVFFPQRSNLLSVYSTQLRNLLPHPPSPPFLFDVLLNHVVLDPSQLRRHFPGDTRYVAVVRQPWHLVQSAFFYFRFRYIRKASSFEGFIRNQSAYEPPDPLQSFTNNRMSIDLGLPPRRLRDRSYIGTFLRHLDSLLDLVLVMERLDESLVLMKRMFNWTFKDIIYTKLNTHKHGHASSIQADAEVRRRFLEFQQFDVALYEHYVKVLEEKLAEQSDDFQQEVEAFVSVNNKVSNFCAHRPNTTVLLVPATTWSAEFSVVPAECAFMTANETSVNSWAKEKQLQRLAPLMSGGESAGKH